MSKYKWYEDRLAKLRGPATPEPPVPCWFACDHRLISDSNQALPWRPLDDEPEVGTDVVVVGDKLTVVTPGTYLVSAFIRAGTENYWPAANNVGLQGYVTYNDDGMGPAYYTSMVVPIPAGSGNTATANVALPLQLVAGDTVDVVMSRLNPPFSSGTVHAAIDGAYISLCRIG